MTLYNLEVNYLLFYEVPEFTFFESKTFLFDKNDSVLVI